MAYFGLCRFPGVKKKDLKRFLASTNHKIDRKAKREARKSRYAWGYPGGETGTLICIKPNLRTALLGEVYLSPVTNHIFTALLAFILKRALYALDQNTNKTALLRRQGRELV